MISNQIISHDEKNNICKNIFNEIEIARKKLKKLEELANFLQCCLPMSSYANFRDALFHYTKIYESFDAITVYGNIYTLREHLERGLKDAITCFLNEISNWLECFCITHDDAKIKDIKKIIEMEFPLIINRDKWNLILFEDIKKYISTHLNLNLKDANYYCLVYFVTLIQNSDKELIQTLRKYMHTFKNQNHKIRSASSILAKPYSGENEFNELIKDIESFYEYVHKENIYVTYYFACGY